MIITMNQRLQITIFGLFSLLLVFGNATGDVITVDDNGPSDYSTIIDAISNSTDGDIIYIYEGNYNESITINKSIQLIGNGSNVVKVFSKDSVIGINIIAHNVSLNGISIVGESKSGSKGIAVNGNRTFIHSIEINSFHYGIIVNSDNNSVSSTNSINIILDALRLLDAHYNVIEDNNFSNTKLFGISLIGSSNNEINSNLIQYNRGGGVLIEDSKENDFLYNDICFNNYGINIISNLNLEKQKSENNKINFNTIVGNDKYGLNGTLNKGIPIDASKNYWGSSSGPFHSTSNAKGKGENVSGDVEFSPWLDEDGNEIELDGENDDEDKFIPSIIVVEFILCAIIIYLVKIIGEVGKRKYSLNKHIKDN